MSIPFLGPEDWAMADVLWGFSKKYLTARYDDPKPIPDVHREWWALFLSQYPQVAIAAPRGTAKSSALTFAYSLFVVLERLENHLLILGSNEDMAAAFVHDIMIELNENEELRADYGVEKLLKETETELIVRLTNGHKFRILAKGAGQRMRGLKWERKRPGMCHVIGTRLIDGNKVEDHASFRGTRICAGFELSIHGHPKTETVTPEHRYWALRRVRRGRAKTQRFEFDTPTWIEATKIASVNTKEAHYIGDPIDTTVGDVGTWGVSVKKIKRRDKLGRILSYGWETKQVTPEEFYSEEWWWFIGLWWGDGHTSKERVGITVADTANETLDRVVSLFKGSGRSYFISQRKGCKSITFCHTAMERWIKSCRVGNSMKCPPAWVEKIEPHYQRSLLEGYAEADGYTTLKATRIASKYLIGLECAVRILARLGIVATIRAGRGGGDWKIDGVMAHGSQQYDLYFSSEKDARYAVKQAFIKDGFLWRRVKEIQPIKKAEFAPIQTTTHDYRTAFGLSHNCLFDDMEDEEMVLNEPRREKFRKWFYGTVRPILRQGGKIRGVGTIIGFDSFLERTMPSEKRKDTVMEPLKVYSLNPGTLTNGWHSIKYRAHNADFSQLLWAEQKNAEDLKKIRSEYAAMGMLDIYGQEFLNDPIDEGTAFFRKEDFLPMKEKDFETRKTYYSAADLAIGEKERNAYTAIVTGGMDHDGFLNIVDVRRARLDGEQIVAEMFSVHERWDPLIFRLESENIEKAIGPFLFRAMDDKQIYINIDSKSPTKDKDKRATSIRARMRAGKVRFNKEADWYADFEEELVKYPKFPYKDQVDAFAWLGLMLEEMVEPQTDQEIEEEEYREQFDQTGDDGRCQVTGY